MSPRFPQGSLDAYAISPVPEVNVLASRSLWCHVPPEPPPPVLPEPSSLLPRPSLGPGAPTRFLGFIHRNALHSGWNLSWAQALPVPPAQIEIQRGTRPGILCFNVGPREPLAACSSLGSPVLFCLNYFRGSG